MEFEREQLLEKLLSDNLSRAIMWLTYAEAKNLALLTFCSGWIVALFVFASDGDSHWSLLKLGSWTALLPFALSALVTLHSFLPQLSPAIVKQKDRSSENEANLLFVGDVAGLDSKRAGLDFRARYLAGDGSLSDEFIADIGAQTVATSIIAMRKFESFKVGSMFVVAAVTVLVVFGVTLFAGNLGFLAGRH